MPELTPIHRFPARAFRSLLRRVERRMAGLGARSRFWSLLYYGLVRNHYAREQSATLSGRMAYQASLRKPDSSMVLLRRNIHRIEKGLLMRPRRVPFALEYIGETVEAFAVAVQEGVDPGEVAWAEDVLTEYFRVHSEELRVKSHLDAFSRKRRSSAAVAPLRIPHRRDLSEPPPVGYDALLQLARRRRSVRWFLQKPVPREDIDRAISVAAQSPSACNRQPFEFRVLDDRDLAARLVEIPGGTAGYGHNIPVVVAIVGRQRNFFSERDRHLIYIDGALAAMSFLLALEAQGIGSCCINVPDVADQESRMKALLRLAPDERPIMLVGLGYPDPDASVAFSAKKSLDILRRYNFE